MANPADMRNLALFCDFENVALGVRDAKVRQLVVAYKARLARQTAEKDTKTQEMKG